MTAHGDTHNPADQAREDLQDWEAKLTAEAGGDSFRLLVLLREHLAVVGEHEAAIRKLRDRTAGNLRDAGEAMSDIADAAGVTDSYLSRVTIAGGSRRRRHRRRTIPRRP